ncbi:hypothetical protein [Hymenobacter rubidus]|uniref:hypothetical protein n=1 Tax=Hymenobacter rubidus TaxID=1441626 RepID=UPI00191DBE64|nr:hypothetical protein [Hymenobacter rubidus]
MIEVDLITKHGKKALGMEESHSAAKGWRHRLPEILLEIGIIVFAVTLSIQLHAWHEHSVERAEERKFLTGLRTDLRGDLTELRLDSLAYAQLLDGFRYFRTLTPQTLSVDTVHRYQWTLYNSTNLLPNTSRFEGLKSAGKLGVIEDDELLNDILDNYQELVPGLVRMTLGFTAYKEQNIQRYLDEHLQASGNNFMAVMQSDPMRNYLNKEVGVHEIIHKYHLVMAQNRKIIRKINSQLASE